MQNNKSFLTRFLKTVLIGRDVGILDKAIYRLTGGQSSGWVAGNKLRSWKYGFKRGQCAQRVVFIGCFPRSGSTLLRAVLQHHPDVAAAQTEVNVFQDIRTSSRKTKMNIIDAFDAQDEEVAFATGNRDLVAVADAVLGAFLERQQASVVLVKQPKHIFFIKEIFEHFPNAKFINIVRDGRDATMSQRYFMLPKGRQEWPYDWCCRQWDVCVNRGKEWLGDQRYLQVRYEDLLKNLTGEANRIFDFIGVPSMAAQDLESFYEQFDKSKHPRHHDVGSSIDAGRINKWLDKMSDGDADTFSNICGANNEALGYESR